MKCRFRDLVYRGYFLSLVKSDKEQGQRIIKNVVFYINYVFFTVQVTSGQLDPKSRVQSENKE